MADPTDRDLVRLYWPAQLRPAFDALFAIDDAMGEVVASSTQPALAAIKLAWWREALERLDASPPPPEPRLQAAAAELLPRGIGGQELARVEGGWAALLGEEPHVERLLDRGALLFGLSARLLGERDPLIDVAGRVYAGQAFRRLGMPPVHRPMEELRRLRGHRFARALRPLTALARLAVRDVILLPDREPEATPARAAALLWHRLSGRVA